MVNDGQNTRATDPAQISPGLMATGAPTVWIDGTRPLSAEAVAASYGPPGGAASLILPADCAWSQTTVKATNITTAARILE